MDTITTYGLPGFREPISCWSHLLAAPVFAGMGALLICRGRGSGVRVVSLVVLVVATVFLLSMSAVYHMLPNGAARAVMKRLDVAGVFALIAGTATPMHAILFRGAGRWGPLALAWGVAAAGITLRTIFFNSTPPWVGNGVFLLMGWGGAVSCWILSRRHGYAFVAPLFWGGVAYTLGVAVLATGRPVLIPGVIESHELWHVAVLVGLGLHWQFVFSFAGGRVSSSRAPAAGRP